MTGHVGNSAFGLLAALALMGPARADVPTGNYMEQSCAWSDPPVAQAALAWLKVGSTIQAYCKTCGDRMSTPVTITRSTLLATSTAFKQVNINGGMLDLSLAYVQTRPNGPWMNLSKLTKCDTPTENPAVLPAPLVSRASPGAPPSWWENMQARDNPYTAREPADSAPAPAAQAPAVAQAPVVAKAAVPVATELKEMHREIVSGWEVSEWGATSPSWCVFKSPGQNGNHLEMLFARKTPVDPKVVRNFVRVSNPNWQIAATSSGTVTVEAGSGAKTLAFVYRSPTTMESELPADEPNNAWTGGVFASTVPIKVRLPNNAAFSIPGPDDSLAAAAFKCMMKLYK